MLVLDKDNTYSFANTVVKVTDQTAVTDDSITPTPPTPDFNVLIPTVTPVGVTNTMELYYPGEARHYIANHGDPNPVKHGFGPDFIHGILSRDASGVGVYTINLRGASASMANLIVALKYKVEKNVAYTDLEHNPYYLKDGKLTTEPSEGATAVVRDVLHVKFVSASSENCKKWIDLLKATNDMYKDTEDDQGYKTIPWFSIMYRGASTFGNSCYFNMTPAPAEYDGNMYFRLNVYDGIKMVTTDPNFSMDPKAGAKYNTTYYIENQFNDLFPTMRFLTAEMADEIGELYGKYLCSVDDYINGRAPSIPFAEINPFDPKTFAIVADAGSIDIGKVNAFQLSNGTDGSETPDELFEAFFKGEIIGDIGSVLRYRITYIPDTGYNADTKMAIVDLVKKRNRMTSATLMLGGADGFSSALIDHQAHFYDTMPNIRQIATAQSPMMFNPFAKRTLTYPACYFDTMALMDHFARNGNFYQPFAGYDARWTGYIEDTMLYPSETTDYINSLQTNRINIVMKDAAPGGYLADQQMNTIVASDQTEFNNAFLISEMLYDLVHLVHVNHFKFNETDDVRSFTELVDSSINTKYKTHSASMEITVARAGTIGRAKSANKITVRINMKDINKFTDIEIILVNE